MTNRAPLTDTQQRIYSYIVSFIRENGYPPTVREIKDEFDYQSVNSVGVHLKNLREKGYITKSSTSRECKARTMRLVDDVLGNNYTIDGKFLNKAIGKLKERGYKLQTNIAVEFLKELKIDIV